MWEPKHDEARPFASSHTGGRRGRRAASLLMPGPQPAPRSLALWTQGQGSGLRDGALVSGALWSRGLSGLRGSLSLDFLICQSENNSTDAVGIVTEVKRGEEARPVAVVPAGRRPPPAAVRSGSHPVSAPAPRLLCRQATPLLHVVTFPKSGSTSSSTHTLDEVGLLPESRRSGSFYKRRLRTRGGGPRVFVLFA